MDPVIVRLAELLSFAAAAYGYMRARLQDIARRVSKVEKTQDELIRRCFSFHGGVWPIKIREKSGSTKNDTGPQQPELPHAPDTDTQKSTERKNSGTVT